MEIRAAMPDDAPAIAAIYAHHVLHGTGTFEEDPPAAEDMARRMAAVTSRGWPYLVAVEGGAVLGYAYAAQFRERAAYRYSCEDSIYIAPDRMGRGVGRALLEALMAASIAAGFRRMLAVIGDSANMGSIRVHAAADFTMVGTFDAAGHKFGRDIDVVFMQRTLGDA